MKKLLILSTLALCACTNPATYSPALEKKPKDTVAFNRDLEACREWAKPTTGETLGLMAFGGLADLAMAADGNDRMLHTEPQLIDRCMAARGYVLKEASK